MLRTLRLSTAGSTVTVASRPPHVSRDILFEFLCYVGTSKAARALKDMLSAE